MVRRYNRTNKICFLMMALCKYLKKQTVLLLVGKTGNGKSSAGNTILREKVFMSNSSTSSVTRNSKEHVADFHDRVIKVIDTPGFEDTLLDDNKGLEFVISEIENVVRSSKEGIHACLIVLRYGARFTMEEKVTIRRIQVTFGEKFMRKHCIILMTCGDDFHHHNQSKLTIEEWAMNQTGDFKQLFDDCEGKIILFDNNKTGKERDGQIEKLLTIVDMLGGRIYTDKHFEKTTKTRNAMMVYAKRHVIFDESMTEVNLITNELYKICQLEINDVNEDQLNTLKFRAEALLSKTLEIDNNTEVLNESIKGIRSLVEKISEEIRFIKKIKSSTEPIQKNIMEKEEDKKRLLAFSKQLEHDMRAIKENRCTVM